MWCGVAVWRCGSAVVWRCGGVAVRWCGGAVAWRCGGVAVRWRISPGSGSRPAADLRSAEDDRLDPKIAG